jgi:hypothetical protein
MERGRQSIPDGGTFSNNGYNLGAPTPVVSYVQRAVPNPGQHIPMVSLPSRQLLALHYNRRPTLGDVIAEEKAEKEKKMSLALLGVGAALLVGAVWLAGSGSVGS